MKDYFRKHENGTRKAFIQENFEYGIEGEAKHKISCFIGNKFKEGFLSIDIDYLESFAKKWVLA